MDKDAQIQGLMEQMGNMEKTLTELSSAFYFNNFSATQDVTKYSRFLTGIKVPHYDTLPATCEVGQLGETSGKLYIASATDTWSLVGTQS